MRDRQESNSPPANHAYWFVEAFLDGERVHPTSLKQALADPEARDHFVDLLLLRDAMADVAPSAPRVATFRPERRSHAKWFAAAAATVLVSLSVGYAAGQRVVASDMAPPNVEVFLPMDRPTSAPAPTRSIAFEPGVNWTDSPGGQ